jgi:hypothetical protein
MAPAAVLTGLSSRSFADGRRLYLLPMDGGCNANIPGAGKFHELVEAFALTLSNHLGQRLLEISSTDQLGTLELSGLDVNLPGCTHCWLAANQPADRSTNDVRT